VDQQHRPIYSDTKTKLQFDLGWFGFTLFLLYYTVTSFFQPSTEKNQGENS